MKILCNYPYEERKNLYRNVEDFFVVAKQYKAFSEFHNRLLKEVGRKYSTEIWCLITGTLKTLKYSNIKFKIPLNQGAYTAYNKCSKQNISYTRMKTLIGKLEDKGYLELYKGFWFNSEDSMSSFLKLNASWLKEFPVHLCESYGITRPLDLIEVVRTDHVYTFGNKKKVKTPISTKGMRGLSEKREDLLDYNILLNDTVICIQGQVVTNIIYKRKFELSLGGHGRYYTIGGFQTESAESRSTLTFNGKPTVEWDISSTQPSILYTWAGLTIPKDYDPYRIQTTLYCDQKELRSFCKVALLCILFNSTKKAASSAIVNSLATDKHKFSKGTPCRFRSLHDIPSLCKIILKELLETNKDIKRFFFKKDLWMRLQNTDATICEYVVNTLTKLSVPVLSIHDSWVVCYDKEDLLIDTIRGGWLKVMGNLDNFRLDKK